MNREKQKKEIIRFLNGKGKKNIDAFSLYQWLDRCFYEGWWNLGAAIGIRIPPNSFTDDYQKRKAYLLKECRFRSDKVEEELKNKIRKIIDRIPPDILESYKLFKNQKDIFVEALKDFDPNIIIELNWEELNLINIREKKNWFFAFYPPGWNKSTYTVLGIRKGFGICFSFHYFWDKKARAEYARFYAGVESPIKDEHKEKIRAEISKELKSHIQELGEFDFWPNAGIKKGGKILECRIPLDNNTGLKAMESYSKIAPYASVLADKIEIYRKNGYFK